MKKINLIVLFLVIIGGISLLNADIVWTRGEGLSAEGGMLEPLLGKTILTNSAEEAMEAARKEYCEGREYPAIRLYDRVVCDYPDNKLAPEALFQMGTIYMGRDQYTDAFKTFQKIIVDYPNYKYFNDVIKIEFEIASKLQSGKRPYYWGIIPGFRDYNASIEYFESIVANAPCTGYAPMALMNIAELAREHRKPEDVVDALDRLIGGYRYSELAPQAYLMLAETYECMVMGPEYDQGPTLKARNYYQDFIFLYPKSELVVQAEEGLERVYDKLARSKLTIGDFYYKFRNNPRAARTYYNESITAAPNSLSADKARKQLELLDEGVLPPKTFADLVFGRYESPSTPAYLEQLELENRANAKFDLIEDVQVGEVITDAGSIEKEGDVPVLSGPPPILDANECVKEDSEIIKNWTTTEDDQPCVMVPITDEQEGNYIGPIIQSEEDVIMDPIVCEPSEVRPVLQPSTYPAQNVPQYQRNAPSSDWTVDPVNPNNKVLNF